MSLTFTVGDEGFSPAEAGEPSRTLAVTHEADLASLPHLLVAGTTGSGKSVFINSLLVDLIRANTPKTLRLLLIDPKRVELAAYRGLPHLLREPVVKVGEAKEALEWCAVQMDLRYRAIEAATARSLDEFNGVAGPAAGVTFPRIVIAIDELANLILVDKSFEDPLAKIAAMGRAAGIHLVAATQRPDATVLTGLLRANIPARVAFATVTARDSMIILDQTGAEKLRGKGDMLFRVGTQLMHLQGRQVRDEDIEALHKEAVAA